MCLDDVTGKETDWYSWNVGVNNNDNNCIILIIFILCRNISLFQKNKQWGHFV